MIAGDGDDKTRNPLLSEGGMIKHKNTFPKNSLMELRLHVHCSWWKTDVLQCAVGSCSVLTIQVKNITALTELIKEIVQYAK